MTRLITHKGDQSLEPPPNPERLTEGRFGPLLREGNRALTDGLDQSAAFRRLNERLSDSRPFLGPRRLVWFVPASALVLAAAFLPAITRWGRPSSAPLIVAEHVQRHHEEPGATGAAAPDASVALAQPMVRPADGRNASSAKHAAHAVAGGSVRAAAPAPTSPVQAPDAQPTPAADPSAAAASVPVPAPAPASDTGAAPDCLSLARSGQTRDAEACFLKRAEGSGLGAEMALYEVARLRRDVLGDAAGALRVLAEYRTRFPAGSLRREANMSQLELLVQLGRTDEALKQSEQLLASSASGERAAELRLLRAHILRKARSFAAAAREYELAESAGARAGDVPYFHALCLEALGRDSEAAALFNKYLEQPQRSYAQDARRRLERLNP